MYKPFNDRIKKLRREREISQENLAKILKTTQPNIARWETGFVEPDMQSIVQLALYFDVSVDYLLGLTDYPYTIKKPPKEN